MKKFEFDCSDIVSMNWFNKAISFLGFSPDYMVDIVAKSERTPSEGLRATFVTKFIAPTGERAKVTFIFVIAKEGGRWKLVERYDIFVTIEQDNEKIENRIVCRRDSCYCFYYGTLNDSTSKLEYYRKLLGQAIAA
jgi:hypothetical protein